MVAPLLSPPCSRSKGTMPVALPFAAAAVLGSQVAGVRELPVPSEREERAVRCRLCRHLAARVAESEGTTCTDGARRVRRSSAHCRRRAARPPEQGSRLRCRN